MATPAHKPGHNDRIGAKKEFLDGAFQNQPDDHRRQQRQDQIGQQPSAFGISLK